MKFDHFRRNASIKNLSAAGVVKVQAIYYLPTGIWPLLHMRSFEWVTGPKVDRWLVKTVGGLTTIIGGVLGLASGSQRVTREIRLLGIGSAVSFAIIDIVYASRGRIRRVYLLDAVANLSLALLMLAAREHLPVPGGSASVDAHAR